MSSALRAYRSLTVANLRMYLRNPIASFSIAGALLILLVSVKLLLGGPGVHTGVVVVNASGGADAAALVNALRAVATFDVSVVSPATARRMLDNGQANLEVAIPSGFVTRDASGRPVPASLAVSYRVGTSGESSIPVIEGVVAELDRTVLGDVPTVSVSASAVHTRATGPIDYLLPGVVAFNIIGSALMVAAGIFANYKSTGVLRRLQATGISPSTFVLSHATSSFVLGMVQTAAILVAAALLYSVHLDLLSLFLLLALGYLVFLAMGLAISGWIRDPQRATAVAQSIAFPLIFVALLSSSLPASVAAVTTYLPVSYVTDGMQHLSEGGQLASIAPDLAWLLGWAIVLLAAAGRAFRWQ